MVEPTAPQQQVPRLDSLHVVPAPCVANMTADRGYYAQRTESKV